MEVEVVRVVMVVPVVMVVTEVMVAPVVIVVVIVGTVVMQFCKICGYTADQHLPLDSEGVLRLASASI